MSVGIDGVAVVLRECVGDPLREGGTERKRSISYSIHYGSAQWVIPKEFGDACSVYAMQPLLVSGLESRACWMVERRNGDIAIGWRTGSLAEDALS